MSTFFNIQLSNTRELSDAYIDEVSTHLDAVSGATLTSGAVAAGFQEVVEQAQAAEVTE